MTGGSGGVPLVGGNSNAPVRFGDRVHRTAGPWSPTVHAYLRHLRAHGAPGVPEPFGFDEDGREVLEFVPGRVPAYPLPDVVWSDAFLEDAARLLRRVHDASTGFPREGAVWQQPARTPDEVVSVNDFAPYNLVVRNGRVAGIIDLDQASPGPRVRDLAHLAYRLAPLTAAANGDGRRSTVRERARRLRLLAAAYGDVPVDAIAAAVGPLLGDIADHAEAAGRPDHALLYRRDATALAGEARALTDPVIRHERAGSPDPRTS